MLILAADTSGPQASVGLATEAGPLAELNLNLGQTHSETLFPMIETLLRSTGHTYADLTGLASVIGPGSFTGIRIGVSALKMMAWNLGCPVYPVSSLQALAASARLETALVAPCLDARNRRVFAALYRGETLILPEKAQAFDLFLQELTAAHPDTPIYLVGEPAAWLTEEEKDAHPHLIALPKISLSAGTVAHLAALRQLAGEEGAPEALMPSYLVPSQAERMRKS